MRFSPRQTLRMATIQSRIVPLAGDKIMQEWSLNSVYASEA
jgi:hypothetical protein